MKTKDLAVSKSGFAKLLACSPSTVTHLIGRGLPVRRDGKLNRDECLRFLVKYTSGSGGGWTGEERGKADIRTRAEALLNGEEVARFADGVHLTPPAKLTDERYQERVAVLRAIVEPAEQIGFARAALQMGASVELAIALAEHFACAPCLRVDIDDYDLERPDLFSDVAEAEWRRALRRKFDFEEVDRLFGLTVSGPAGSRKRERP